MSPGADWYPPSDHWQGKTVFILGGGPSLRGFQFEQLRPHALLAINALGYAVLPRARCDDVLFGHDEGFFAAAADLVSTWPGLIVTTDQDTARRNPGRIHRVRTTECPLFKRGEATIKRGRSSGHTGISLAVALGARKIVLLGFDMRLVDGRSHSHDLYRVPSDRIYRNDFLPHFRRWKQAAERAQVQIINATPGSRLTEFPRMHLPDVLESFA